MNSWNCIWQAGYVQNVTQKNSSINNKEDHKNEIFEHEVSDLDSQSNENNNNLINNNDSILLWDTMNSY